jgi:hypothetical protein
MLAANISCIFNFFFKILEIINIITNSKNSDCRECDFQKKVQILLQQHEKSKTPQRFHWIPSEKFVNVKMIQEKESQSVCFWLI